jgi:hypothetical protein
MEDYLARFHSFPAQRVYDFKVGDGGVGDCIKFFMFALETCMKCGVRLLYKRNHLELEKYLLLKHEVMYTDRAVDCAERLTPQMFYATQHIDYSVQVADVFCFAEAVRLNAALFPIPQPYSAMHLRLGDDHLETDRNYVDCKSDHRAFSEESMGAFIESRETVFFCCDNAAYKLKWKEKYPNLHVLCCPVGHSGLRNTTPDQVLATVTEFYILAHADYVFGASPSGFSKMAAKFSNAPYECAVFVKGCNV